MGLQKRTHYIIPNPQKTSKETNDKKRKNEIGEKKKINEI